MFKFFLKKNFCDIWDNMFHHFVINCVMFVVFIISGFIIAFFKAMGETTSIPMVYLFIGIFISLILISIFALAEGENAVKIANFDTPRFKDYFSNIGKSVKDGVLLGTSVTLLAVIAAVSIPYYFTMWLPSGGTQGNFMGLVFLLIIFWFLFLTLLALQWYVPVRSIMHNGFFKSIKKCYILTFDNMGITLAMALNNLVLLAISLLLVGFLPGVSGFMTTGVNMLRIRLYKYDWMEVNPGMTKEQRRNIPWNELLARDKRTLGPRTFKSFLFPWKM